RLASAPRTALVTVATRSRGGVAERTTKFMTATSGPIKAGTGISGPPAIDIGMYNWATGVGSPSAFAGVAETTPTIVSQSGAGSDDVGSVDDFTRCPIGS